MKIKRSGIAAITAVSLMLSFTACTTYPKANEKTSVNVGTPSQSPDEKQSEIDDKASELATSEPEAKEGTGKYSGQADNNFIEIEIGEKNYNVFQLSEELKEKFEELKLETGDSIQFKYEERKDENPLILEITNN